MCVVSLRGLHLKKKWSWSNSSLEFWNLYPKTVQKIELEPDTDFWSAIIAKDDSYEQKLKAQEATNRTEEAQRAAAAADADADAQAEADAAEEDGIDEDWVEINIHH